MLGKVGEKWWKEDRSGGPDTERQRVAREWWHYCCVQSVPFCLQQTGFIQNPPWIKLALETGKPVSLNETRTIWLLCGELKPDHPPVFSRCVGLITGAQPYVKITGSIWGLFCIASYIFCRRCTLWVQCARFSGGYRSCLVLSITQNYREYLSFVKRKKTSFVTSAI